MEVPVHRRRSRRVPLCIHELHVLECSHPESGDDIVLQLRKSHAETRMPADAPANPAVLLLLVLSTVGEVALRVESLWIRVDVRIEMNIDDSKSGVCIWWNHFCAFLVERDRSAGDVLAESGARKLQADALFEYKIGGLELELPGFHGNMHETIDEWEGRIGTVAIGDTFCLFQNQVVPFLVVGQVKKHPGSVDSGVELTGEEGA
jgi:hypothetical protein